MISTFLLIVGGESNKQFFLFSQLHYDVTTIAYLPWKPNRYFS